MIMADISFAQRFLIRSVVTRQMLHSECKRKVTCQNDKMTSTFTLTALCEVHPWKSQKP